MLNAWTRVLAADVVGRDIVLAISSIYCSTCLFATSQRRGLPAHQDTHVTIHEKKAMPPQCMVMQGSPNQKKGMPALKLVDTFASILNKLLVHAAVAP